MIVKYRLDELGNMPEITIHEFDENSPYGLLVMNQSAISPFGRFFDTWEQAHAALVKGREQWIASQLQELEDIKGMKPSDGDVEKKARLKRQRQRMCGK